MPLIKARTHRIPVVRHICRLQEPNRSALVLYALFICDTVDYVLNQLIATTLVKDRGLRRVARGAARSHADHEPRAPSVRSHACRTRTHACHGGLMRTVLQHRLVLSLALTSVVGVLGLQAWPFPAEHLVLALIQAERPGLYAGFQYAYTTLLVLHAVLRAEYGLLAALHLCVPMGSRRALPTVAVLSRTGATPGTLSGAR